MLNDLIHLHLNRKVFGSSCNININLIKLKRRTDNTINNLILIIFIDYENSLVNNLDLFCLEIVDCVLPFEVQISYLIQRQISISNHNLPEHEQIII